MNSYLLLPTGFAGNFPRGFIAFPFQRAAKTQVAKGKQRDGSGQDIFIDSNQSGAGGYGGGPGPLVGPVGPGPVGPGPVGPGPVVTAPGSCKPGPPGPPGQNAFDGENGKHFAIHNVNTV
jgi:hypothetical protein